MSPVVHNLKPWTLQAGKHQRDHVSFLTALSSPSTISFISQRGGNTEMLQCREGVRHRFPPADLPAICQVGLAEVENLNSMRKNQMIGLIKYY